MFVRLGSALFNLALLIALAAVALVGWRLPLAERGAEAFLQTRGFTAARVEVAELAVDHLRLGPMALGPETASAESAEVRYRAEAVLEGRVESVAVSGLRLTLDLSQPDPLARFRPLMTTEVPDADERPPGAPPVPLPAVELRDADVVLLGAGPARQVTFRGDATLTPHTTGDDLDAALRGRARTPASEVEFSLTLAGLRGTPRAHLEALGTAALAELPWPAAWPARPADGTGKLELKYDGPVPRSLPASALDPMTGGAAASGRAVLRLADVELPGYASGLAATADLGLDLRPEGVLLRLNAPLEVTAATIDPAAFETVALPPDATALLSTLRRATLAPWTEAGEFLEMKREDGSWRLDSRATLHASFAEGEGRLRVAGRGAWPPDPTRPDVVADTLQLDLRDLPYGPYELTALHFEGDGEGGARTFRTQGNLMLRLDRLPLQGRMLEDVAVAGPMVLERAEDALRAALTGPARLTVARYPLEGAVQIPPPLEVAVPEAEARLGPDGLSGQATVDPGTLNGTVLRADGPDVPLVATPGPIELRLDPAKDGLRVSGKVRGARAALPAFNFEATGLDADLSYGDKNAPLAVLTVDRLAHTAEHAIVSPLSGRATVRLSDSVFTAEGALRLRNDGLTIPFQTRHDPRRQEGRLRFGPATAAFSPGGLSPGKIAPFTRSVTEVSGRTSIEGELRWGPGGFESRCALTFAGLTLQTPEVRIEDLTGAVEFDRILPPRTAPEQELTASRIVAGVPLDDVRLRFDFTSSVLTEPIVHIEEATGALAEGTIAVRATTLQPMAPRNAMTLEVEGLSMARLFEQLDLEGVNGEGRLSGSIPVVLRDGQVIVDEGRLVAESAGVLRIRLAGTGQALASQGEQVALMLRALENFQYDVLELTVMRPADGNLKLGVTMEGRNPDVLDGYPFRFNISLTGDLQPLLTALREGQALTTELLQRAIDAQGNSR